MLPDVNVYRRFTLHLDIGVESNQRVRELAVPKYLKIPHVVNGVKVLLENQLTSIQSIQNE
jgi:hypothetical protein